MNRINPQYMLIFFLFIALFMWFQSGRMQSRAVAVQEQNVVLEQNGKALKALKESWKNPEQSRKTLEKLFAQAKVKPFVRKQEAKGGIYRVVVESMPGDELERLANAVLNEPLDIKSIEIERAGENNASMKLECQL